MGPQPIVYVLRMRLNPLSVGDTIDNASVVRVAEAGSHGVALLSDGTVRCWGDERYGKCRVPKSLGPVIAVDVSDGHTMVLQADGRVRAWGGLSISKPVPSRRVGRVIAIKAGSSDRGCWSAARLEDGRVRIWAYGACPGSPWPVAEEHRLDFVEWCVPHLMRRAAIEWLVQERGRSIRDWSATDRHWVAVLADGRTIGAADRFRMAMPIPEGLGPLRSIAIASGIGAAVEECGRLRVWFPPWNPSVEVPERQLGFTEVSGGQSFIAVLDEDRCVSIVARKDGGLSKSLRMPDELQGRIVAIHATSRALWAVDEDGRLHGRGKLDDVNSLPFELKDESWLEFATRMWGKTKQKIYPEHIRRSAEFKAIRMLHRLAEE